MITWIYKLKTIFTSIPLHFKILIGAKVAFAFHYIISRFKNLDDSSKRILSYFIIALAGYGLGLTNVQFINSQKEAEIMEMMEDLITKQGELISDAENMMLDVNVQLDKIVQEMSDRMEESIKEVSKDLEDLGFTKRN